MLIVGTDFSPQAAAAALEARSLAVRLGVRLRCAHIRQFQAPDAWVPSSVERAWMDAAQVGEDEMAIRRGTPWVELVRLAAELGAETIVVGTHGHSGFQPIGLGSTAARLALLSPVPTLLVGGRERGGEERRAFGKHSTKSGSAGR